MGIFKTLAFGLKRRLKRKSIPYVSGRKAFANYAEEDVSSYIKKAVPNSIVKTNVLVETKSGRSEIDCLVIYNNKLFIIEIKRWKGTIIEKDNHFYSFKVDRYTDGLHQKEVKSPFAQVNRQIKLLKEMTGANPWMNTIVFFADANDIRCNNNNVWFTDIHKLVIYIYKEGRASYPNQIKKFMNNITTADFISSSSILGERNLHCLIDKESLEFETKDRTISKKDISKIHITHHFSYDELEITLRDHKTISIKVNDRKITIKESGEQHQYYLSKINNIVIGE